MDLRETGSGPEMAITLLEEYSGLGREKQVADLRWLLPWGRVQRTWEREAGSGPEMAIALGKSPADLGERGR